MWWARSRTTIKGLVLGIAVAVLLGAAVSAAPAVRQSLVSNLARLSITRAYYMQSEECSTSAFSRVSPVAGLTDRLAMLVSGTTPRVGEVAMEFGAEDLRFEETWALQLRDLGADFGEAAPQGTPSPLYLRYWSNASASITASMAPGCYTVSVTGMHDVPGPVLLKVYANGWLAGNLWFCQSDNSWGTESLYLTPSFWLATGDPAAELVLTFHFANDGPDERGLRDAGVALVRVCAIDCLSHGGCGQATEPPPGSAEAVQS